MRQRNVKNKKEIIKTSKYFIEDITSFKGKWNEVFENSNPIHIEVGMGKGQFLMKLAESNPDINYIGIEKYSSVLLRAIQKREESEITNLYFIRMDAETIAEVFEKDEVDKIYLNFSDPWPKDRHAKRRLTSKEFFARYHKFLKPEGRVEFKTDNVPLFEFSLEQVKEAGWILEAFTYDLHHDELMSEGNVMTEYEAKFSGMGNAINKLIAYRNIK